jgi:hypothetical protein
MTIRLDFCTANHYLGLKTKNPDKIRFVWTLHHKSHHKRPFYARKYATERNFIEKSVSLQNRHYEIVFYLRRQLSPKW